jgi:hypothetical protein
MQEKSIFEELAPFSRMLVLPGLSLGQLQYVNQQDLYSEGLISSGATGIVARNASCRLFQAALNQPAAAQGFAAGTMHLGLTNSKFQLGQAPANQVFVALYAGFSIYQADDDQSGGGALTLLSKNDLFAVAQQLSWQLNIGRGISRTIGSLGEWPAGTGVYASEADLTTAIPPASPTAAQVSGAQLGGPNSKFRKLQTPIVFPPLVPVEIDILNGSPFTLSAAGGGLGTQQYHLRIRMTLQGTLMTLPVG